MLSVFVTAVALLPVESFIDGVFAKGFLSCLPGFVSINCSLLPFAWYPSDTQLPSISVFASSKYLRLLIEGDYLN